MAARMRVTSFIAESLWGDTAAKDRPRAPSLG
jgi:hypothetical protein